ncbi:hypothetical protein ACWD5R_25615 [Streptomyces sp. NPDC002514]|uniref:hypothetical protein n=1 Tax=Streptomyces sp. NPDC001270 TaxID=3364554 RepID=UPI00367BF907
MTDRGGCRTGRAGVFAAACVLLAALGHVTMSQTPVPWWALAVGATVTGAAGWLLAGRERGRTLIVTVVTAAQAVLHEMFSLAQTLTPGPAPDQAAMSHAAGAMDVPGTDPGSMPGMDMGSMHGMGMGSMNAMDMGSVPHPAMGSLAHLGHLAPGTDGVRHAHGMAGMSGMGGAASLGMIAAHLLAALLCGLWLAHGERAVFRVLRAAAARLAAPLRMLLALPVPPRRPSPCDRRAADGPAPARTILSCTITSRGPPAGAAVA